MNTRVSWIDPDRLGAVLARLLPPEMPAEDAPAPAEEPVTEVIAFAPGLEAAAVEPPHAVAEPTQPEPPEPVQAEIDPEAQTMPAAVETAEIVSRPVEPVLPEKVMEAVAAVLPAPEAPPQVEPPPQPVLPPKAEPAAVDEPLPLDRIRERLRMIRHRAVEAGILSHEMPPEPVQAPPKPSFEAKVEAFARQVMPLLSAETRLLVMDSEGALLWSNDPQPGLVLSTLMALRSAEHASLSALAGAQPLTHHELPPDQILSVLRVPSTSRGPLQVAVKGALPLPNEAAAAWTRLLAAF